jgi:hypothetical protein
MCIVDAASSRVECADTRALPLNTALSCPSKPLKRDGNAAGSRVYGRSQRSKLITLKRDKSQYTMLNALRNFITIILLIMGLILTLATAVAMLALFMLLIEGT